MKILENVFLKEFTTFKIGGPARFFVSAGTVNELRSAVAFAREKNVPIFVLGGGSNVLVSDEPYPGLVIKVEIDGLEYEEEKDGVKVAAGAGVVWDKLVESAVERGLFGLENLSLIPGTVGAAPVQNIGAYGREAKDCVKEVEALNTETGELELFSNQECAFGYRTSFFKTPAGKKYIITKVTFKLSKNGSLDTDYKDIQAYISSHGLSKISLKDLRSIIIDIRTKKLPDLARFGTAGSFFKNPIISKDHYAELLKTYPLMPGYEVASPVPSVKVPAAWILDNVCGFKGYREGDAGVYENQALVLVNFGGAHARDVESLADKMTHAVLEKTRITLEREVEYVR